MVNQIQIFDVFVWMSAVFNTGLMCLLFGNTTRYVLHGDIVADQTATVYLGIETAKIALMGFCVIRALGDFGFYTCAYQSNDVPGVFPTFGVSGGKYLSTALVATGVFLASFVVFYVI